MTISSFGIYSSSTHQGQAYNSNWVPSQYQAAKEHQLGLGGGSAVNTEASKNEPPSFKLMEAVERFNQFRQQRIAENPNGNWWSNLWGNP